MQQSVTSLFELYLARSDLRPASVRFKRQALRYFVEWFGDDPVGAITPAIAEDYRALLVAAKAAPGKQGGRGLSKSAANGYLANFKPFWLWCQKHGRVQVNPFQEVPLFKLTKQPRETFTAQELGRIIRVADDLWKMRVCLGLLGDRRGEMLATVVSDVHLDDPKPHILLSEKKATATTYAWGIKDHAIRYVALPAVMEFDGVAVELHRLIRERIASLPPNQPYVFLEDEYARKCAGKEDIADPTGNFQRTFRAVQKRAQVGKPKRFHELRAAFATAVIQHSGISVAADALGHSSIQTTRGYNRATPMSLVADLSLMAQKCYKSNVS